MSDLGITGVFWLAWILTFCLLVGCAIPVPIPTFSAPPEIEEFAVDTSPKMYVSGWGKYQDDTDNQVYLVAKSITEENADIKLVDAEQFWLATNLPQDGAPLQYVLNAKSHMRAAGLQTDYLVLINQPGIKIEVDKEAVFTHAVTFGFTYEATIIDWKKQSTVARIQSYDERNDWEVYIGAPFVFYNALRTDPKMNACEKLGQTIASVIMRENGKKPVNIVVLAAYPAIPGRYFFAAEQPVALVFRQRTGDQRC